MPELPTRERKEDDLLIAGRLFPSIEDPSLLYIGGSEDPLLHTLIANIGVSMPIEVATWTGSEYEKTAVTKREINKVLMKRYALIEKIKSSEVIGILVGTVVVDGYLEVINKLKEQIIKAGKKCYEVLVGKLNEPKLKNMAQVIDLYCLVTCRETSLIDSMAFNHMPVVTPHEVLLAISHPWESKVTTDLTEVLKTADKEVAQEKVEIDNSDEEDQDKTALVKVEQQALIPIFSA